jgi:general secretion pathway protein D
MASHLKNLLSPALLAILLSGCAAQMAYRDGKDLIAKDQVEAGLAKYQEAVKAEPGNAEYRATYLQARDRATQRIFEQADRDQAEGRNDMAAQAFRRVLALDPLNERARAGLRGWNATSARRR